jgi:gluconate 2-dehydrogenase subunit 3-like protein
MSEVGQKRAKLMNKASEYLTDDEMATLAKVVDILFPPGDDGVGAVEVGVLDYIGGVLSRQGSEFVAQYRQGLRWLNAQARGHGKKRFDDLSVIDQERIVDEVMEKAHAESAPLDPATPIDDRSLTPPGLEVTFMASLWRHTREGLFGDPRHGGNRDGVVWRWLGYSGPQLHGYTDSEILANETPQRPLRFADDWKNHHER